MYYWYFKELHSGLHFILLLELFMENCGVHDSFYWVQFDLILRTQYHPALLLFFLTVPAHSIHFIRSLCSVLQFSLIVIIVLVIAKFFKRLKPSMKLKVVYIWKTVLRPFSHISCLLNGWMHISEKLCCILLIITISACYLRTCRGHWIINYPVENYSTCQYGNQVCLRQ